MEGVLLLEVHKENGLNRHKPHCRNKLASHPLTNLPFDLLRLHVYKIVHTNNSIEL